MRWRRSAKGDGDSWRALVLRFAAGWALGGAFPLVAGHSQKVGAGRRLTWLASDGEQAQIWRAAWQASASYVCSTIVS